MNYYFLAFTKLTELFQSSDASGSRSTILKPLTGTLSVLFAGLILLVWADAPDWLYIGIGVAIGVILILIIGAYIHFARKNPDALRSEKYYIQKMAIERGIFGDDTAGIIDLDDSFSSKNKKRVTGGEEGSA